MAVRGMVHSPIVWLGLGGPEGEITPKSPILEKIKNIFEQDTGLKFHKKDGGVKYPGLKGKVCGYHLHRVALRVGKRSKPASDATEPLAKKAMPGPSSAATSAGSSEEHDDELIDANKEGIPGPASAVQGDEQEIEYADEDDE
eukprot:7381655-Prymnesium_polylepis.1